ncbi:MAG: TetR/AcrR family transcriptional regulator [Actinomycetota bacterium]|nr:TetR/AcrR family transcriptional regulator [Actinomycetota bacterium]
MDASAPDSRQTNADRSVEAILDGAERLLQRREQPSILAVAHEAGVSRPTVYAHFGDRQRLLEALVERTVRRALVAIDSAEPDRGPAFDALRRLIAASWEDLGHHEEIADAAAAQLSTSAMRRAHESARAAILKVIERGRREGAFRTDLTTGWQVTTCLAMIHAAAEEVRAGELDSAAALELLCATITHLLRAPAS